MFGECVLSVNSPGQSYDDSGLVELLVPIFGIRPKYEGDGKTQIGLGAHNYGTAGYHKAQLMAEYKKFGLTDATGKIVELYGIMLGVVPEFASSVIVCRLHANKITLYLFGKNSKSIQDSCWFVANLAKNRKWPFKLERMSSQTKDVFRIFDDVGDETIYRGYIGFSLGRVFVQSWKDAALSIALFSIGFLTLIIKPTDDIKNIVINLFSGAATLVLSVAINLMSISNRLVHWVSV